MAQERDVNTIKDILNSTSVAVVGASADPEKWGYKTLKCIIDGGYEGNLYAINPKEKSILGVDTYRSLEDIPGQVDLLVVIIPAVHTPELLREGLKKKAKGAVILTSGYREAGRADLEEEILDVLKSSDMRVIGPNVQGINYIPNKLCAVVAPLIKMEGPIGVISQSGSISATISEWAEEEEIGISGMINVGNQLDLCETDFLEFFADDENTKAIALYMEGPKDGERFKKVLKEVALKKPVIILKPGKTKAGITAAASHTASVAGDDVVFTSACKQFGAIRAGSVNTFYNTTKLFATQKLPKGKRVLVLTTSGGAGALTIDSLNTNGLETPQFSDGISLELNSKFKTSGARYANPLDIPSWELSQWLDPLEIIMKHDVADIYFFSIADAIPNIEEVILSVSKKVDVPIVVSYMGGGEDEKKTRCKLQKAGIPVFSTPEEAAESIGYFSWYADFRREKDDR